jgi:hypothetical protein
VSEQNWWEGNSAALVEWLRRDDLNLPTMWLRGVVICSRRTSVDRKSGETRHRPRPADLVAGVTVNRFGSRIIEFQKLLCGPIAA